MLRERGIIRNAAWLMAVTDHLKSVLYVGCALAIMFLHASTASCACSAAPNSTNESYRAHAARFMTLNTFLLSLLFS